MTDLAEDVAALHPAPGGGGWLVQIPLISNIEPGFWLGGCHGFVRLPDGFDFVLSCTQEEFEHYGPNTERIAYPFFDSPDVPPRADLEALADRINAERDAGREVLVHCTGGRNRSALVAALSLMRRGMTADEAIDLLRERRGGLPAQVLFNGHFADWLRAYD